MDRFTIREIRNFAYRSIERCCVVSRTETSGDCARACMRETRKKNIEGTHCDTHCTDDSV